MATSPTIYFDIITAAAQEIAALGLTYFGDRVHPLWAPDPDLRPWPNVQLVTEGVLEEQQDGHDLAEGWRYPVVVWLCNKERTTLHGLLGQYLTDRKRIIQRFNRVRMPLLAVPDVHHSFVAAEPIVDRRFPQYQHVQSGLILNFDTLED